MVGVMPFVAPSGTSATLDFHGAVVLDVAFARDAGIAEFQPGHGDLAMGQQPDALPANPLHHEMT